MTGWFAFLMKTEKERQKKMVSNAGEGEAKKTGRGERWKNEEGEKK